MGRKRLSGKTHVYKPRRKSQTEKVRHNARVKHEGRTTRNLDVVLVKWLEATEATKEDEA